MIRCPLCDKEVKNLKGHHWKAHGDGVNHKPNTGHKGGNQFTTGKNKTHSDETKKKLSKLATEHNSLYWTDKNRDKHSDVMLRVVKENPNSYNYNNVCRRVKRIEHNGEFFHSSWELEFSLFLDEQRIKWTRKTKPFDYIWNNKLHRYFPDFYLEAFDLYVEVKGYKVDKDDAKWNQFKGKLLIIRKEEFEKVKKRVFRIEDYYTRLLPEET